MQTNVSTLLREFPKVRQAALRGERVVIVTQEGNLLVIAENPPAQILSGLKGSVHLVGDVDLTTPTTTEDEWMQ